MRPDPSRHFVPDISELRLDKTTSINFPEGKDKLLHFEIGIKPDEGMYRLDGREPAVASFYPQES